MKFLKFRAWIYNTQTFVRVAKYVLSQGDQFIVYVMHARIRKGGPNNNNNIKNNNKRKKKRKIKNWKKKRIPKLRQILQIIKGIKLFTVQEEIQYIYCWLPFLRYEDWIFICMNDWTLFAANYSNYERDCLRLKRFVCKRVWWAESAEYHRRGLGYSIRANALSISQDEWNTLHHIMKCKLKYPLCHWMNSFSINFLWKLFIR